MLVRVEHLLPHATSADVQAQKPTVAVLPIGSFEQHGAFHPLVTDTVIACAIAKRIAEDYALFLLPPVTMSLSHEHAGFPGSVSIRATTLVAIVSDVVESLRSSGIRHVVLVNGHGGNYVLQNVVQEANVADRQMTLFPLPVDWNRARADSSMETDSHEDMHAGELETSILLHVAPELLRAGYDNTDWRADDRKFLLMKGMSEYTQSGVIGFPSLGTAEKGKRTLESLSESFKHHLEALIG
ncbi:creatininase family protein [Nocardia sp. NBC_01503]|uniref:creatininase family protein n=1 Tax=Nocardia sp. NBC_01503 TaxID=2975997 RepID=UPI002E7BC07A|nr:creatininase family protein [Nocardia sp. NBC_01503]WTL30137.1 creatininase family protein [Nocardia sp. NBC_01503]